MKSIEKERKKFIDSFYPDLYLTEIVCVFLLVMSSISILLYIFIYLDYSEKTDDSLLNAVLGYYLIALTIAQNTYMSSANFFKGKTAKILLCNKNDKTSTKSYETMSVLPIRKKELISMDIRHLKRDITLMSASLVVSNIVYIINSNLERVAGFFVLITIVSLVNVTGDFFAKYYHSRVCYRLEVCSIIAYFAMVTVNFIGTFNSNAEKIINKFLDLEIFKYLAGVPMIILSVMIIPVLYFVYKRTDFERGKASAWMEV